MTGRNGCFWDAGVVRARAGDQESAAPPGVDRLLSLSDGVVAISLTLIAFQLHIPQIPDPTSYQQLVSALSREISAFTSYLVAFFVIAQFWLAHHRVFRGVRGHHEGMAWLNFFFLFAISLMSFTSDLLGHYSNNPIAVDIFAFNLLLASLSTQVVVVYGRRTGVMAPMDPVTVRTGQARVALVVGVTLVSIVVAWVSTNVATLLWILLIAMPFLSRWVSVRTRSRLASP